MERVVSWCTEMRAGTLNESKLNAIEYVIVIILKKKWRDKIDYDGIFMTLRPRFVHLFIV